MMRQAFTTLFTAIIFLTCHPLGAQDPDVDLLLLADGFTRPIDISHAPNDTRLFITEQPGMIKIINGDGDVLPTPFLNITGRVGDNGNEQGLLGLTFHPRYAENGYFYVNYTNTSGTTTISRFTVNATDPNLANPNSEKILMTVNQPFSNHNAGDLAFGPDGYLYFGLGDGGSGGDPQNRSQTPTTLLGKMIRIDVDNGDPYAIPASNPFVDAGDTLDEIWAFGLRNPWRMSFDRQTGDLWIGDVGQNVYEEINFQPAGSPGGENYGWRCYEGNHTFNTSGCGPMSRYTFPVTEYAHGNTHCSVTGGFVYRGLSFPNLKGRYIFGDYCSGVIWSLLPGANDNWVREQLYDLNGSLATFGESSSGELYLATLGGAVYQVIDNCAPPTYQAVIEDVSCMDAADGAITLTFVPDEEPARIVWSNGETGFAIDSLTPGVYQVTLTDDAGCGNVLSFTVDDEQPEPPTLIFENDTLRVLDTFTFYQWYRNDAPIAGATEQTYVPTTGGVYQLAVGFNADCLTLSEAITVTLTSTETLPSFTYLQVSPNPFSDQLTIRWSAQSADAKALSWALYDGQGRLLQRGEEKISGQGEASLTTATLPAGVYWLNLWNEWGHTSRRVIKQ